MSFVDIRPSNHADLLITDQLFQRCPRQFVTVDNPRSGGVKPSTMLLLKFPETYAIMWYLVRLPYKVAGCLLLILISVKCVSYHNRTICGFSCTHYLLLLFLQGLLNWSLILAFTDFQLRLIQSSFSFTKEILMDCDSNLNIRIFCQFCLLSLSLADLSSPSV